MLSQIRIMLVKIECSDSTTCFCDYHEHFNHILADEHVTILVHDIQCAV